MTASHINFYHLTKLPAEFPITVNKKPEFLPTPVLPQTITVRTRVTCKANANTVILYYKKKTPNQSKTPVFLNTSS